MQSLSKENALLKQYIQTLQKQNDSKNKQRTTLIEQLDQLAAELDKMSSVSRPSHNTVPRQEFLGLQREFQNLLQDRQLMIRQFTQDIRNKEHQCQVLTQQLKMLSEQNAKYKISGMTKKPSMKPFSSDVASVQKEKEQLKMSYEKEKGQLKAAYQKEAQQKNHLKKTLSALQIEKSSLQQQRSSKKEYEERIRVLQNKLQVQENQSQIQIKILVQHLNFAKEELNRTKEALQTAGQALMQGSANFGCEAQTLLKQKIALLESRQQILETEKTEMQNRMKELFQQVQQEKKPNKIQKESHQMCQERLKYKQEQFSTLQEINTRYSEDIKALTQSLKVQAAQIQTLHSRVESITTQKDLQIEAYEQCLREKVEQNNKAVSMYNGKMAELTQSKGSGKLQQQTQKFEQEQLNKIKKQTVSMEREFSSLKEKLHSTESAMKNCRVENQMLRETIQNHMNRIAELQETIRALRLKLDISRKQSPVSPQIGAKKRINEDHENALKNLIQDLREELKEVKSSNNMDLITDVHQIHPNLYYHQAPNRNSQISDKNNYPRFQEKPEPVSKSYMRAQEIIHGYNIMNQNDFVRTEQSDQCNLGEQLMGRKLKSRSYYDQMGVPYNGNDPYDLLNLTEYAVQQLAEQQIMQTRINSRSQPKVNSVKNKQQKWENLQKKINTLKEQNEELKKTIFE